MEVGRAAAPHSKLPRIQFTMAKSLDLTALVPEILEVNLGDTVLKLNLNIPMKQAIEVQKVLADLGETATVTQMENFYNVVLNLAVGSDANLTAEHLMSKLNWQQGTQLASTIMEMVFQNPTPTKTETATTSA